MDQVEQLKKMALRSVTDRHKVQELTEENTRLRSQVPSMKKRLEEAQRQQRLEQETGGCAMKLLSAIRAAGGTQLHRASDGRHRSDAGLLGRTLAGASASSA